jgi:hypothetical protein
MPPAKRAKKAKEEEEDRETVCMIQEKVEANLLEDISQLWLDASLAQRVNSLLDTVRKKSGWNLAVYKRAAKKKGRVYAGSSLQTMKGWVTRVVSGNFYTEIDIHGCAPTLVIHLAEKFKLAVPTLEQYVVDRAQLFDRVRLQTPALGNAPDSLLKKAFLVAMHGGSYQHFFKENNMELDVFDCPPLASWCEECEAFTAMLRQDGDEEENGASLLALSWQALEVKILLRLKEFFSLNGFSVGVLKHDAVLVEFPHAAIPFPEDVLQRAVVYVREVFNVRLLKLVEKKLTPTKADWDLFYGPKRLDAIKTPLDKVVHLISRAADKNQFKRMGTHVYAQHAAIPCVWAPVKPLIDFINETTSAAHYATPPMDKAMEWCKTVDHPRFQLLKQSDFDDTKIAFKNGYLDVMICKFTPWSAPRQKDFITCHFFAKDFDPTKLDEDDTPTWSKLIDHHLAIINGETVDRSCCRLLEALIGRMFLPTGTLDRWSVAPAIIGDANTGKSTIATVVTRMFPELQVATIGSSMEEKFGLMNLLGKRAIVVPDMPVNLQKVHPLLFLY